MTKDLVLDISHADACLLSLSLRNLAASLRGGWTKPVKEYIIQQKLLQLADKVVILNESRHHDVYHRHWCNEINKVLSEEYR